MRHFLLAVLVCAVAAGPAITPDQSREIVEAAWQAVNEHFYDPHLRGLDWDSVKGIALKEAESARTPQDLERILYRLFVKLNNSHSGLSTPEERARRAATIPIAFDRVDGRLFVAWVAPSQRGHGVEFGDEVLSIDSVKPSDIVLPTKRFHRSVAGNPIYGPASSTAAVEFRRGGAIRSVSIPRTRGVQPADASEMRSPAPGIVYLRLNVLGGADIPPGELRSLFAEAAKYGGMVLDLRDCPGGDMQASAVLAGLLLGPDKDYYTIVPRNATGAPRVYNAASPKVEDIQPDIEAHRAVTLRTHREDVRYTGRLAVLTNARTASEPENIVAAIKVHRRGRVFGSATMGATHGWSIAIPLPHKFGAVAVPYTRTIMADGKEYEGSGIEPYTSISNRAEDYAARRDAVLEAAVRSLL
jgi:C-terminal processing protease CtpA/Prc